MDEKWKDYFYKGAAVIFDGSHVYIVFFRGIPI